mmetsp:Transcript_13994/g.11951  ORF Transcript_13994/g.11951 Transcript_13994/m.11951 type:complete len:107 (-) Transcript_13994:612-932(-)
MIHEVAAVLILPMMMMTVTLLWLLLSRASLWFKPYVGAIDSAEAYPAPEVQYMWIFWFKDMTSVHTDDVVSLIHGRRAMRYRLLSLLQHRYDPRCVFDVVFEFSIR